MDIQARRLVFHSAVVTLVAVLCGLPLEARFALHWPAETGQEWLTEFERAWRLAHGGLMLGAVLGLAVAGILSSLVVEPIRKSRVAWCFIVSNYAFCIALVLAPIVGQRGLIPVLPWTNLVVLLGNFIGAFSGLAGTILLLRSAWHSLQMEAGDKRLVP
jgi:hypothetical protein